MQYVIWLSGMVLSILQIEMEPEMMTMHGQKGSI